MLIRPFVIVAILFSASLAKADLIETFQIDGDAGDIASDTQIFFKGGLVADGVIFDATLTVTGSGNLNQISSGMGVQGNNSDLVNEGEFLSFTMSISNVSGGTIMFQGFTEIDTNNFGSSDTGFLSIDSSAATTADNDPISGASNSPSFDLTSGTNVVNPTGFSIIAADGGSNSFRVDDVSAAFVGTAVPEPSAIGLLGPLISLGLWRTRRRD
ncbi:MAG: hypothetical protein ACE361_07835 [Aureliella sp.]